MALQDSQMPSGFLHFLHLVWMGYVCADKRNKISTFFPDSAPKTSCGLLSGRGRIHSRSPRAPRSPRLRIALRARSNTLTRHSSTIYRGCGLLSGRGRIHLEPPPHLQSLCCGLLSGRGRIHCMCFRMNEALSCGLLSGRGRIHYSSGCAPRARVADCSQGEVEYTVFELFPLPFAVADCSQGEVEYTPTRAFHTPHPVADCSQGEVEYTPRYRDQPRLLVADCSQGEVEYTTLISTPTM